MMKVTKITKGNLTSRGITFKFNEQVEVSKEVGEYLLKTFPSAFQYEKSKTNKGKVNGERDTERDDENSSKQSRRSRSNKRKSAE